MGGGSGGGGGLRCHTKNIFEKYLLFVTSLETFVPDCDYKILNYIKLVMFPSVLTIYHLVLKDS